MEAVLTIAGVALSTTQLALLAVPLLFVAYTYLIHTGYDKSNPLVWSWVPHLRSAALFGQDPNTFLQRCREQYGPIFTVNLGGKLMTFVTDPRCFQHVTRAREGLSFMEVATGVARDVLAQDVEFANDKDLDVLAHAQYAKYLTGSGLDDLTVRFQDYLQEWLSIHFQKEMATAGAGGITGGLLDLTTRAIFSASTRALYGDLLVDEGVSTSSWDEKFADDFFAPKTLLSTFQAFDSVFPLLYGGLPHFLMRGGIEARDNLTRTLRTLRANHSSYMAARKELMVDAPPNPRPNDQHNFGASQLGTLWALQGNTIPATFWTIFNLMSRPADLARVQAEIRSVLDEANRDNPQKTKFRFTCNRDSLKKLTLLDAAISESLRLATGSMMMRHVTNDLQLDLPTGPLRLKPGDNIAVYPFLAHHDASIFPNPEEFLLDRWIDKSTDSGMVTDIHGVKLPAFLPFGSGPSMCPGRHFARNEIKLFLATFFNLFDITSPPQPQPGYLLSRAGLGIYPPAKDVNITYVARQV